MTSSNHPSLHSAPNQARRTTPRPEAALSPSARLSGTGRRKINTPKINTPKINTGKINTTAAQNRILAVLAHTSRYAFKSEARLARDCGVSSSTITRLVTGQSSPSFALVSAVTRALEKALKRPLDPRDLVSFDGTYPTPSVCDLCGCRGCLPADAYDVDERLRPAYRGIKPGQWSAPTALHEFEIAPQDAPEDAPEDVAEELA